MQILTCEFFFLFLFTFLSFCIRGLFKLLHLWKTCKNGNFLQYFTISRIPKTVYLSGTVASTADRASHCFSRSWQTCDVISECKEKYRYSSLKKKVQAGIPHHGEQYRQADNNGRGEGCGTSQHFCLSLHCQLLFTPGLEWIGWEVRAASLLL